MNELKKKEIISFFKKNNFETLFDKDKTFGLVLNEYFLKLHADDSFVKNNALLCQETALDIVFVDGLSCALRLYFPVTYSEESLMNYVQLIMHENCGLRGARIYLFKQEDKIILQVDKYLFASDIDLLMKCGISGLLQSFSLTSLLKIANIVNSRLSQSGVIFKIKSDRNLELIKFFELSNPPEYYLSFLKKEFIENSIEIFKYDNEAISFSLPSSTNSNIQTICKVFPEYGIATLFSNVGTEYNQLSPLEINSINAIAIGGKLECHTDLKMLGIQTEFLLNDDPVIFSENFNNGLAIIYGVLGKYIQLDSSKILI